MLATLFSREVILGTVELSVIDRSMGGVCGTLTPSDNYYFFRSTFKKRLNNNHPEIVKLKLNLQLKNGYFLFPSDIVVFQNDDTEFGVQVSVSGNNRLVIENLKNNNCEEFLIEPWRILSVERKFALEKELVKEIRTNNLWSNWFKTKESHLLTKFYVSALGISGMCDDVLFEIRNKDSEYSYAVVHLTWSSKLEKRPILPYTTYYRDLGEFKYFKMYPDRNEWES